VAQGQFRAQGKSREDDPEELKGKFILGELHSVTKPEFSEYMRAVAAEASRRGEGG